MGYEKREWQDDVTELDKEFFDYMQNGIVYAAKTAESLSPRVEAIEKYINRANYKSISVSVKQPVVNSYLYGTALAGAQDIWWTISKNATEISITTPKSNEYNPSETHTKRVVKDDDGNQYIEVVLPGDQGIITVKNEGQEDSEEITWVKGDGTTADADKAKEKYAAYRRVYLKANEQSYFQDARGYWIITKTEWIISAKEAAGKENDDGTITYNSDTDWRTITPSYNVYYGKSKNANESSAEFIVGSKDDEGNWIVEPMNTIKNPITSRETLSITFKDGADDEYLYIALPEALYSAFNTFNIWEDNFTEEFKLMNSGIQVGFAAGYPTRYYLFRSPNPITDKGSFNVRVS